MSKVECFFQALGWCIPDTLKSLQLSMTSAKNDKTLRLRFPLCNSSNLLILNLLTFKFNQIPLSRTHNPHLCKYKRQTFPFRSQVFVATYNTIIFSIHMTKCTLNWLSKYDLLEYQWKAKYTTKAATQI